MANHEQIMINEPASNLATKYIDTYGVTVGSTLLLREYTVIGGSTPTALADVITTDPTSITPGIVVRDANGTVIAGILSMGNVNTTLIASRLSGSLTVQFDPGHTLGLIDSINKTVTVQLDPGHTLGSVLVNPGTGTLNVQLDPGHTLGLVEVTDGTNIANTLKSDGTAAGQNSLLIAGSFFSVAYTTTSAQAVGATDVGDYNYVSVHQTNSGGSSVTNFQGSNDNVNWIAIGLAKPSNTLTSPTTSTSSAADIFSGPLQYRYFRLNVTGIVSGTTAGTIVFFTNKPTSLVTVAGQLALNGTQSVQGAKTNNNAVPGATNIGVLPGIANASAPTYTEGDQVLSSLDLSGNTRVIAQAGTGTFNVALDPGHTLGIIDSITKTVAVYFDRGSPAVSATFSAASIEVIPTTGSRKTTDDASASQRVLIVGSQTNASLTINGTVTANAGTGSLTVQFDPGHELGSIKGITNTVAVHLLSTGGTLWIKPDPAGTYFTNNASTAGIFTVSGSTSGVSVSGVNLVAPSAAYNFKVFAYSIQTTGIVSVVPKFVNGSGASQTEFWRPLATANQTASTPIGANMAVPPPAYLFATGTNTSLNLLLDTATLVHYSVSYIKESA